MYNSELLVIDFEGFRHGNQLFIPKEISVRGSNYHDTILLQPPVKFSFLTEDFQKTYSWLTRNVHGINWDSGTHDHSFLFNFFNSIKLRFPNSSIFAKGKEKCAFLRNFFFNVIDLDTLGCPKASQFSYNFASNCQNHLSVYRFDHCAQEKANLFYDWVVNYYQRPTTNECAHCSSQGERQSVSNFIPESESFSYNNLGSTNQNRTGTETNQGRF